MAKFVSIRSCCLSHFYCGFLSTIFPLLQFSCLFIYVPVDNSHTLFPLLSGFRLVTAEIPRENFPAGLYWVLAVAMSTATEETVHLAVQKTLPSCYQAGHMWRLNIVNSQSQIKRWQKQTRCSDYHWFVVHFFFFVTFQSSLCLSVCLQTGLCKELSSKFHET